MCRGDRFSNGCAAATNRAWRGCDVPPDEDDVRSSPSKNKNGFVRASKLRREQKMKCARIVGKLFSTY